LNLIGLQKAHFQNFNNEGKTKQTPLKDIDLLVGSGKEMARAAKVNHCPLIVLLVL